MNKRNFLAVQLEPLEHCHGGDGVLPHAGLFGAPDFATPLRFINYTILPPGTSIGLHTHGDDEELYIILEGEGVMEVDGERASVAAGDIVVNRPFGTHGLFNTSDSDIRILVMEAYNRP